MGEEMRTKGFLRRIVVSVLAVALLGGFTTSTFAQGPVRLQYGKIWFHSQQVSVAKADGSKTSAEFLFAVTLLSDGRANGGFGLWEQGGPDRLSLYRIVEGRVVNRLGPFYEFKARRLFPASEDEITITVRPSPGQPPAGSVTFIIDGISSSDGQPLSFEAAGRVHTRSIPIASVTDLIIEPFEYMNAPPQTVVVETRRGGNSTALFENVGLVFPNGEAIGFASLSQAEGIGPIEIRYTGGKLHFDDEEFRWGIVHGRTASKGRAQPLPVLIVIADSRDASEPCRIYDIAGWQGGILNFEAETEITQFTIGER